MKSSVSIANIGELDILTGQLHVITTGIGEVNRVQIPASLPSRNRFFIVENAVLYLTDNNVNGTISTMWPAALEAAPQEDGLAFVLPATSNPAPNVLTGFGPAPSFTLNSLGPGLIFKKTGQNTGAGTSLSMWTMDTARRIIIPQSYILGAYIQDPGDGSQHDVTATLIAQVRWFDLDECAC